MNFPNGFKEKYHRARNGLGLFARASSSDSGPSRSAEARDEGLRLGRSSWGKDHPTLVLFGQSGTLGLQ